MAQNTLTLKQEKFIEEYIALAGNGTQAALRAFDIKGKNPEETAASMAHEYLRKPHIKSAVEARTEEYLNSLRIDKLSRLKRLGEIFHGDDKRSVISANREITKMTGEYAPTKVQNMTAGQSINKVVKEIRVEQKTQ